MIDPLFDLSGKVALVTGGSRGLGLEMVRAFASHGADVIISSRKLDACEAAAAEVRTLGRRALAVAAHLGKWEDAGRLAEVAYAEFGRVDILVNNAGMGPAAPSHEVTEELFDKVVGLNFKGPFRLAALVAKRMACLLYTSKTGLDVRALPFYMALALFKLAVIMEGWYFRHLKGESSHPAHKAMETEVPNMLARAAAFAKIA